MADPRAHAEAILRAAIAAADPVPLVTRALTRAPQVHTASAITLIAIGKAAVPMAEAAHDVLGSRIAASLIVAPHGAPHSRLPVMHASHPIPDDSSVAAAEAVERLLARAGADGLVIVLLSGGASALTVAPAAGISVLQYAGCVRQLLRAGADIRALNTVRQHIDRLKGGGMAALAAPAPVLGLVLSDVVRDPLDIIASGPLTRPAASAADAQRVLDSYGIELRIPRTDALSLPTHAQVEVIGNNALAVEGAAAHARRLGYRTEILPQPITGEARDAGSALAERAIAARDAAPLCILGGGETTVTVNGTGTGGRNQELVLAAALALADADAQDVVIGSIATDGVDGPTVAAGAVADAHVNRAAAAAALANNDSYRYFREHGGLIVTAPTSTNVADVQVAITTRALFSDVAFGA